MVEITPLCQAFVLSPNKPSDQSRVTTYSGIDEGGFPPSAQLATLFWCCSLISFAHLPARFFFGMVISDPNSKVGIVTGHQRMGV